MGFPEYSGKRSHHQWEMGDPGLMSVIIHSALIFIILKILDIKGRSAENLSETLSLPPTLMLNERTPNASIKTIFLKFWAELILPCAFRDSHQNPKLKRKTASCSSECEVLDLSVLWFLNIIPMNIKWRAVWRVLCTSLYFLLLFAVCLYIEQESSHTSQTFQMSRKDTHFSVVASWLFFPIMVWKKMYVISLLFGQRLFFLPNVFF